MFHSVSVLVFRRHVRGVIQLKIQSYMWSSCFENNDFGVQRLITCDPIFTEAEITTVVNKMSGDDVLMEELRYWMSTLTIASIIGDNSVAKAKRVKSLIDSELAECIIRARHKLSKCRLRAVVSTGRYNTLIL
jgi:hypothetical protein